MVLRIAQFELKMGFRKISFWVYCIVFFSIAFLIVNVLGGAFLVGRFKGFPSGMPSKKSENSFSSSACPDEKLRKTIRQNPPAIIRCRKDRNIFFTVGFAWSLIFYRVIDGV